MSLNKVLLIGYVGREPEVRYFSSSNLSATIFVATVERGYKTAEGTEIPDRTDWHRVVAFRDQARFIEKWVKKGSVLLVEGKLHYRTYTDKAGVQRYVTEILAERVSFYDSSISRPVTGEENEKSQ